MKTKKVQWLDCESKIGDKVQWYTITKQVKTGILIRMDNHYIATVKLEDGSEIQYKC